MRASRGPLDIDTGVVRRDRFLLQQTPVSHLFVGFGRRAVLIDRISEAETALKSGYDPGEGRDDNGRWTAGGGIPSPAIAAASLAPAMSATSAAGDAVLAGEAGGFLVAAAPAGLAALSEFLLPLAAVGAVVVLGYLAIRRREDETSTGTVMNRPDINYEYDPMASRSAGRSTGASSLMMTFSPAPLKRFQTLPPGARRRAPLRLPTRQNRKYVPSRRRIEMAGKACDRSLIRIISTFSSIRRRRWNRGWRSD